MFSTSIEISLNNNITRVSVVYKRPGQLLVPADLDVLTQGCDWFIVTENINVKHSLAQPLHTRLEENSLPARPASRLHGSRARYAYLLSSHPGHRPDVLDIAVVKFPQIVSDIHGINDLFSDHNPMILTISDSPIKPTPPRPSISINWAKFSLTIDQNLQSELPNKLDR